jgi:hypothetical protein
MTAQEKYMFAADIFFALLSIWFLFPQCKWTLWLRLIFVVSVWGSNLWFFFHDNNVRWLDKYGPWCYRIPCGWIAWATYFSWLSTERGRTYFAASKEFQRTHQWLLWGIAIVIGGIAIAVVISAFPDFVNFFSH